MPMDTPLPSGQLKFFVCHDADVLIGFCTPSLTSNLTLLLKWLQSYRQNKFEADWYTRASEWSNVKSWITQSVMMMMMCQTKIPPVWPLTQVRCSNGWVLQKTKQLAINEKYWIWITTYIHVDTTPTVTVKQIKWKIEIASQRQPTVISSVQ